MRGYRELTFTDNFMFCKVLSTNPNLCKHVLELILGKSILAINIKGTEYNIDLTSDAKSIRMDVYLDDDEGTVYDLEMQTASKPALPKRLRYYQGMMDLNLIEKGMDYDCLPESIIIFICTFDFFNKGLPFYTFENRCDQFLDLKLGDGTKKIFVNPQGDTTNLPEDVIIFLDYIKEHRVSDKFTEELDQAVVRARVHREWEVEYMEWRAYEMDRNIEKREARAEGLAEGLAEGRSEGLAEGQQILYDIVQKLKAGISEKELLSSGTSVATIELAKKLL